MDIRIGNLSIRSDSNCFQIIEHKVHGEESKKFGEEKEVIQGYYSEFDHALKGLSRLKLIRSDATTIKEASNEIKKLKEMIAQYEV